MATLNKARIKSIIAAAPPGTNPAGIIAELRAQGHTLEGYPGGQESPQEPVSAPASGSGRNAVVGALPGVGAFAGGLLGAGVGGLAGTPADVVLGPFGTVGGATLGGIRGAASGGAGGEALAQLISGESVRTSPGKAAAKIAGEGAVQGAMQGGGALVGKGAGMIAKPVMAAALRSTPEVAKVAIREGITATQRGFNKLVGKITQSAASTSRLIRQATARGHLFSQTDIAQNVFKRIIPEIEGQAHVAPDTKKLVQMTDQFLRDHPGPMTPAVLHKIKQSSDAIAKPIYRKIDMREPVTADDLLSARWHKAMADHARDLLHGIDQTVHPVSGNLTSKIAQSDAYTSELIKLRKVLFPVTKKGQSVASRAVERGASPYGHLVGRGLAVGAGATVGGMAPSHRAEGAVGGAIAGAALSSPAMLSWLALHAPTRPATGVF